MGRLPNTPSWGVLVWAPVERLREILSSFEHGMNYRTNGGWTAAFYMEPDDTSNDEAAELLRQQGYVPVFRFDFSKYVFSTSHWDGERWTLLYEGDPSVEPSEHLFVDPVTILDGVGIRAPFDDPDPNPVWVEPLKPREAIVIEGASVDQARQVAGDTLRIEPGPRGAIVYQPDLDTRFAFWERAPGCVLEVKFYPKSGEFWYRVMKGEECLGTFRPGETRSWDGTPFLASVDGETEPALIVEKLGIPRSFVDLEPGVSGN